MCILAQTEPLTYSYKTEPLTALTDNLDGLSG